MRTLVLTLDVIFILIELISTEKPTMTLKRLFPGSNGIELPPIEELAPQDTQRYRNFRTLENQQMSFPNENFLKRGHVIFALKVNSDVGYMTGPLSDLFSERLKNRFIVFDTSEDEWVTLSKPNFEKLGLKRNLLLLRARDVAVAMHKLDPNITHSENYEAIQKAHEAASEAAYIAGNREEYLRRFQPIGRTSQGASLVQQAYSQAYAQERLRYSG